MKPPINKTNLYFDTWSLVKEAKNLGIKANVLSASANTIEFNYNGESRYIIGGRLGRLPYFAYKFCHRKDYTYKILGREKLPTPKYQVIHSVKEAEENQNTVGFPCTVKVVSGTGGYGVYTDINSVTRLQKSVRHALEYGKTIMVEENLKGDDYRMLATPQKLVHAVKRLPARVIGDGKSTIEQLVKIENTKPNRGSRFKQQLVKIELDEESKFALHQQGLNFKSVPKKNQIATLKTCCNQCKGGEVVGVTENVHPDYAWVATAAVRALKVPLGGVDIITEDITKPISVSKGKIIEINENPGLLIHKYPSTGTGMEIYKFVLETLFERKLRNIN